VNYISRTPTVASAPRRRHGKLLPMVMNPFRRGDDPYPLVVSMTGVKMGDRIALIGCAHGARLAAIAAKVGLSGRAVAVVPDESSAARVRKGAEHGGVLVEVDVAPLTHLPGGDDAFDVAIVDDTAGLLGTMRAEARVETIRELLRILRPGGRVLILGAAERGGFGAILTRAQSGPPFTSSGDANRALEADGFRSVRTLAEREGIVFVEGVKPR
jgi:ubiquinone/menaquinone biosynthesis C-methylase UbiE